MKGNEEQNSVPATYLSLIYDVCLVRNRLETIVAELGDTIYISEITTSQLSRVIAFLDRRLQERGINYGDRTPTAVISDFQSTEEETMGS